MAPEAASLRGAWHNQVSPETSGELTDCLMAMDTYPDGLVNRSQSRLGPKMSAWTDTRAAGRKSLNGPPPSAGGGSGSELAAGSWFGG